jgi:23S rRNA (uridine2552-2'-O)-methyltransferase
MGRTSEWYARHVGVSFVRTSKAWGYRARAACKLKRLDAKYGLMSRKCDVLELGSSPGVWSQYISYERRVSGMAWRMVSVDTRAMVRVRGVSFVLGDITEAETLAEVSSRLPSGVGLILSDICPTTRCERYLDSIATAKVAETLLMVSRRFLLDGGALLHKTFVIRAEHIASVMERHFSSVEVYRDASSRSFNSEAYLLCVGD